MDCNQCNTSLSIQDLIKNEWIDDSEVFTIKCPICHYDNKLVSPIFESDHISIPYLKVIILDSKNTKKEKYTDYIPEEQRNKIFKHLSACQECSDRIENYRLTDILKEINFSGDLYNFFLDKAWQVDKDATYKVVLNGHGIKKFTFNDKVYNVSKDNIFYENENIFCYRLEDQEFNVGMASFVKEKDKFVLDKLWLKTDKRIEKEKKLLASLKSEKVRILFYLFKKMHHFV